MIDRVLFRCFDSISNFMLSFFNSRMVITVLKFCKAYLFISGTQFDLNSLIPGNNDENTDENTDGGFLSNIELPNLEKIIEKLIRELNGIELQKREFGTKKT